MRESFTQIYVHLVWATWDRLPLITPALQASIYACIRRDCAQVRCDVLALGGVEDHVHLLVQIPATVAVSDLVKQIKGSSSHLAAQQAAPGEGFKWQGSYGAFSIGRTELPTIIRYIERQPEHHRDQSFHPELELPPAKR